MQQARLRVTLCKKSQITAVAVQGRGPLFLDQNEARRAEKFFLPTPLSNSLDDRSPLISRSGPAMNCTLYLDMIMLDNAGDSYSTSSPGTMKKTLGTKVTHNRAFSLTCPSAMLIYWNKRLKHLHEKRVQLHEDFLGTPTWPPFYCYGTPIWPPWRYVKTLFFNTMDETTSFS